MMQVTINQPLLVTSYGMTWMVMAHKMQVNQVSWV